MTSRPTADWERALGWRAGHQADLVTRAQCRLAGLGASAIRSRVDSGAWLRLHPGVYLTRPGRFGWDVDATAAFLAVQTDGPLADAAWAGPTAALAWGLVPTRTDSAIGVRPWAGPRDELGGVHRKARVATTHLVVPEPRRVRVPAGTTVRRLRHWWTSLDPEAFPWRTTVSRTVLDLTAGTAGSEVTPDRAVALVTEAVRRRLLLPGDLRADLLRLGRHRHRTLLLDVLGDVSAGAHSAAEVHYVRKVERAHGLPEAERQSHAAGGARIHDNDYAAYGVDIEVDGRTGHEGWGRRIADGRRDRRAAADGQWTSRVFWTDVAVTPCQTAVEVGAVLRARGWTGHPRPCRRRGCLVPAPPPAH